MERNETIKGHRRGSLLVNALVLMFVLVLTGTAFMRWAADEAHQATFDLARTQAYYMAQKGLLDGGLHDMRSLDMADLPTNYTVRYERGEWLDVGMHSEYRGRHIDAYLTPTASDSVGMWVRNRRGGYEIGATGEVEFTLPNGETAVVQRRMVLDAKLRSYADYMYLTNFETTRFNEIIWFWQEDTLYGRVHSNDQIGIKNDPTFLGPVSTTAEDFAESNANPNFEYDPTFEAPEVYFPTQADEVRSKAGASGTFITNNQGNLQTRIIGGDGSWEIWQWDAGDFFDEDDAIRLPSIPYGSNVVIFVEGNLELMGESIAGRTTIGTEGQMYLIDNVKYADVDFETLEIDFSSTNMLGLISESNIIVANSEANGRQHGVGGQGDNAPHEDAHIVITAAIVALGESFTFEHQNDEWIEDWDRGNYNICAPGGPGGPDKRGLIYIRGSLAQYRRGYVHRSNCSGTGYDKSYYYDFRLPTNPPPVDLTAKTEAGRAVFGITGVYDDDPRVTN